MKFLDFFSKIGELKEVKRSGWLARGIESPESVSDHSFRLALLALVYAKQEGLDVGKCVELALVHDLHEVNSGDIIWPTADEKKKFEEEKKGMHELIQLLPEEEKQSILDLWNEYAEKQSPEAKLVHDLDKIEMLLQVLEYLQNKKLQNADEFFELTKERLLTEKGLELWTELNKRFQALK